jgi:hypothetical protein
LPVEGEEYLYDVSNDGERFLAAVRPESQAKDALTVVQSWTAGLKQ